VKLIAEPWDATGASLLGRLPEPWSEWNGEYRDAVRRAWRDERESRDLLGRFATSITGSSNVYGTRRCATASVNFVACHDGPTLADLTSYAQKHNEVNGEGNRDGPSDSFASNWGVEGATTRSDVVAARALARRNMIATLALSLGVPMLQHGDELGRTQLGLDNGYCQDGPQTWVDWHLEAADRELLAFVCDALALRRSLAVFRRSDHFTGAASVDGVRDLVWLDPSGREMGPAAWSEATSVTALYDARAFDDGRLALLLNVGGADREFALPAAGDWKLRLATSENTTQHGISEGRMTLPARSLALLQSARADGKVTA
jgi:glycogen operon protein